MNPRNLSAPEGHSALKLAKSAELTLRGIFAKSIAVLLAATFSFSIVNLGPTAVAAQPMNVSEMLDALKVSTETVNPAYSRDYFKHWVDVDRNGCDTRAEVLMSESRTKVSRQGRCTIVAGEWLSVYDNTVIKIGSKLDVDHLVPLAEAWRSGASAWSAESREAFANDLSVSYALLAVSATSNRSKGDQDPANWLPKYLPVVCTYIGSWIAVKYRWSLSVDPGEQRALSSKLGSCGSKASTPVPVLMSAVLPPSASPTAPILGTPTPVVSAVPASQPSPSTRTTDPKFSSCAEAKRNGYKRKYVRGVDPEYYYYRDGDGDGTVCE